MRPAPARPLRRLAVLAVAAAAPAGDPVPDVDVILEQIPGGDMRVEETTGRPFDRVEFKDLPRDFAAAMDGAALPAGWSLRKEGKKVWLEGSPPGGPVRLKIHIGDVERPRTMSYEVSHEGRKLLARQKQPVKTVAKQEVVGSLQGLVQMPSRVAPGEAMEVTVLDPSALPAGGTWSLAGGLTGTVEAEVETEDEREDGDPPTAIVNTTRSHLKTPPAGKVAEARVGPDGSVVFAALPDDLRPGGTVALRYVDRFGDTVVDVPSVPGVEVVAPRGGGEARLTDASPRGLAGQLACVCGSFPGPAAWNALLLDGQAVGSPTSASGQMVWVPLPAGLPPGEHVFTGAASAGFPATDRATTLVLQVVGELDSSKLRRLETTPMRLRVVGTEEPIELRVRNLTPAVIAIEGADQALRTSGGARNQLERTVRGIAPGAFNISYELAGQPCPCAAPTAYY